MPEGSHLDRRTCSDACRQKEYRADERARRNYVLTLKHTGNLPAPDGSLSAEAVAEIEFDTNLTVKRLAATKPDGVVSDYERSVARQEAERAYDRREPVRRKRAELQQLRSAWMASLLA